MNDTKIELIEFVEEKLREIYEIPFQESVCVQLRNNILEIYIPYISPDNIHISVDGLLKQLRGITRVTSYLTSKTRFVKNILKNGISCKNANTPFFKSEIEFFERNKRAILKELLERQSRVNTMYSYVCKISSLYMLNCSDLEFVRNLIKINMMFSELKSGTAIKEALEGKYNKSMTFVLERGAFTVYYEQMPIFQHDINEFTFECVFKYPECVIPQYKEFRNFFENKIPSKQKMILKMYSQSMATWMKYWKYYELDGSEYDSSLRFFKCTSNSVCSDISINSVSLASKEVIDFYKRMSEKAELQIAVFNKKAYLYLSEFLNPVNYLIVKTIQASDKANRAKVEWIVKDEMKIRKNKEIVELGMILTDGQDNVEQAIDSLLEKGYITEDKNHELQIDKKIIRNVMKAIKMYKDSLDFVKSSYMAAAPQTSKESNFEEMLDMHDNNDVASKDIANTKPIKSFSLFDLVAFLRVSDKTYTQDEVNEVMELVKSPLYHTACKDLFVDFFTKYEDGQWLPLIQVMYILT